jgi:hypothetical protein
LARQRRRSLNFLVLERLLLDNSGNSLLKLGELAALAGLSVEHTCLLLKQLDWPLPSSGLRF